MSTIPQGYTSITPFIVLDDTKAAIELYKQALGAEVIMSMPAPDGNIMYAELQIGSAKLMVGAPCVDSSGQKTQSAKSLGGSPVSFYVYVEDVQAAFDKAKNAGLTQKKEVEEMFWGDRIGTLTDSFGMEWTVAEHVRDVSEEEMADAIKKMAC